MTNTINCHNPVMAQYKDQRVVRYGLSLELTVIAKMQKK